MKAIFAHVSNIKAFPSQGNCRIELEIPIEHHRAVVDMVFDENVLVTLAPAAMKDMPYGVVEPTYAQDRVHAEGNAQGKGRPGPLCLLAAQWCRDPLFWKFLAEHFKFEPSSEDEAAVFLRDYLEVGSRRDIDTKESAALRFKAHVRVPYMAYMEKAVP